MEHIKIPVLMLQEFFEQINQEHNVDGKIEVVMIAVKHLCPPAVVSTLPPGIMEDLLQFIVNAGGDTTAHIVVEKHEIN